MLDKEEILSKEFKSRLKESVEKELAKVGIKTSSDRFSNFLIKIRAIKKENSYIVNINLFISEDINPSRDTKLQSIGITYSKSDFFETKDLQKDVYESIY